MLYVDKITFLEMKINICFSKTWTCGGNVIVQHSNCSIFNIKV